MNKSTLSLKQYFLDLIKPYKWYLLGIVLTSLVWAINNSVIPYVLKLIIDKIVDFEGDKLGIFAAVEFLIILYIFLWILFAANMRFLDWIKLKFFISLRFDIVTKMFSYLNRHSNNYFQNNFSGSLSNKIFDMTGGVISVLSTLDDALAQSIGLVIALIAMFIVHPIFACIFLCWAVSFIVISIYFSKPILHLSNVFATSKTTLMGKIVDSIGNINNVRLFSRNNYENNFIREATTDTVNKDRDMQWYILKMHIFWDISIIALIGINLYVLANMYSQGLVTVGDFTFIISLSMSMFFSMWFLAGQFVQFSEELGKCKQAMTIMNAPHEIADKPHAQPLAVQHGKIEFFNVIFHYDKGRHIFNNKNVTIEPGQKIGLVGFSGSGKSTFVNLILRLFDVESGEIKIDGQNIADVTQDSLRENITIIPQDITLFHRTLMDNIRYGNPNASDDEVISASKKAHCHEFVIKLNQGYQSLVGERGIKLSAGQRQRIAIARALLKNSPILIFDEATSALDSITEKLIQNSLHVLMAGKTTLVIAHRLSTLSAMDRILVFENGHIMEDGTPEELLKKAGHYAKMWHMQAGGFLPEHGVQSNI